MNPQSGGECFNMVNLDETLGRIERKQDHNYCILVDHLTKIEALLTKLVSTTPETAGQVETKQSKLPVTVPEKQDTFLFIRELNKIYMDDPRIGKHILQGTLNQKFLEYGLIKESPSGKYNAPTELGLKTGWIVSDHPTKYAKEKCDQYVVMMLTNPKAFKQYLTGVKGEQH